MKTAIQTAIDKLIVTQKSYPPNSNKIERAELAILFGVEEILTELLPAEQKIIEDACDKTCNYITGKSITDLGKTYYETNFKDHYNEQR